MKADNISNNAQYVLCDLYVIKRYTKATKSMLASRIAELWEGLEDDEIEDFILGLEELKHKGYIHFEFIEESEKDMQRRIKRFSQQTGQSIEYCSYLLNNCERNKAIDFIKLKFKAKIYALTHINYKGELKARIRKKALSADDLLLKVSESGTYIVVLAISSLILSLIDTILNAINTFR